jgi:DNA-binding NtrC family response regulator
MPHMTGLQMMDAMRLKGHLMPTIVTTGYASLPKTDVAVTTVSKPFGLDELETAIAETMVEPVH